jgi:hypothetical protein
MINLNDITHGSSIMHHVLICPDPVLIHSRIQRLVIDEYLFSSVGFEEDREDNSI